MMVDLAERRPAYVDHRGTSQMLKSNLLTTVDRSPPDRLSTSAELRSALRQLLGSLRLACARPPPIWMIFDFQSLPFFV
jgi:hypothetical protein